MSRPLVQAGQHVHRLLVLRLPSVDVVRRPFVLPNAVGGDPQLPLVPLVDGTGGHAERLPVLESDRVREYQRVRRFGIHQRISHGQHATGGMTHHAGARDIELPQERGCVGGQLLEAVLVVRGLGGGTEADLVGHDDAVARAAQRVDLAVPRRAAEVLAVHQDDSAAIGCDRRSDVHVGHLERFAL